MRNYFSLPQINPGNQRIDFSPINNALETYRDQKNQNAMMDMRREEQAYQRGRDAKQDARQAEADTAAKVRRLGEMASAYDRLTDPAQRQAGLKRILMQHPNAAGLGPEYNDPATAFKLIAAEAGQWRDPMDEKMKAADLAYKQAQTSKLYADAKEGAADFGKAGTIVQGKDGRYYAVRFRADGTEQINPLEVGGQAVTPDRGTDVVGDTIINKATGQEIRNVGSNIAAGEQKKVEGREMGERKMAVPKARASLRALETQHRNVLNTIDRAMPQITKWTTGLAGQTLSSLGGTDANDLRVLLNTIKANLGFDKLQDMRDNSPTGGALGQVAVAELEMLQSAFASVEQSQTPEQLRENVLYLTGLLKEMQNNRRMAFDETYGSENRPQVSEANDPKAALKQKYGVDLE